MEEPVLKQLSERALHQYIHELGPTEAQLVEGSLVIESRPVHPLHDDHLVSVREEDAYGVRYYMCRIRVYVYTIYNTLYIHAILRIIIL